MSASLRAAGGHAVALLAEQGSDERDMPAVVCAPGVRLTAGRVRSARPQRLKTDAAGDTTIDLAKVNALDRCAFPHEEVLTHAGLAEFSTGKIRPWGETMPGLMSQKRANRLFLAYYRPVVAGIPAALAGTTPWAIRAWSTARRSARRRARRACGRRQGGGDILVTQSNNLLPTSFSPIQLGFNRRGPLGLPRPSSAGDGDRSGETGPRPAEESAAGEEGSGGAPARPH